MSRNFRALIKSSDSDFFLLLGVDPSAVLGLLVFLDPSGLTDLFLDFFLVAVGVVGVPDPGVGTPLS